VETARTLFGDQAFSARHRAAPQAFTRARALPFALVVALIMRKGVKSLKMGSPRPSVNWAARR
jgi:hypothetical protein